MSTVFTQHCAFVTLRRSRWIVLSRILRNALRSSVNYGCVADFTFGSPARFFNSCWRLCNDYDSTAKYMGASYLLFYGVTAQLTILNIFVLSLVFSFFVSGMAVSNKPWKKIGIFLWIWSFFEPKFHRRPKCLPWTYTKGMNEQWGLLMNHHLQWIMWKRNFFLTRMVIELFRNRRLDWLIIASLRTSSFRVTFYQFTIKKNR